MNQITWSENAMFVYDATLDYITERWSEKVASKLEQKVDKLMKSLETNKHLCQRTKMFPNLRRCVVSKQSSLVYSIDGDAIHIIAFYDNRSDITF